MDILYILHHHGFCNHCSILYYFGDKARYWPKIAIFAYPCIRRHRGSPSAYCHGTEKSEWYGYLANRQRKKLICLAVSTEYGRVTDGQSSYDSLVRAVHSIARKKSFTVCSQLKFNAPILSIWNRTRLENSQRVQTSTRTMFISQR